MNVQAAANRHHTSTISYLTGGLWDYVFRAVPAPPTRATSSRSNNEYSTTSDVPPSAAPSSVQAPTTRSLAGPPPAAPPITATAAAAANAVVQPTVTLPPSRAQRQRQTTDALTPAAAIAIGHPLAFDIDHDRRRRTISSCDSIGDEMTHFKPIELMPISTHNGSAGSGASGSSGGRRNSDSSDDVVVTACSGPTAAVGTAAASVNAAVAAAAESPLVMYVPKVRYAATGQTIFAPAKSKFKPESPQKLRLSAFCLVTKTTTLLEQQLFSAVAAELNRPAPPAKANTRQSRSATAAASAGASSSNGAPSSSVAAAATTTTATYSVQHSTKSQQKMMCNIRLNKDNRDRIIQERGDFELAKKLQQFDDEPRLTRPTRARGTTAARGQRRQAATLATPPPATAAKRSRQSAPAPAKATVSRSSEGDSSTSPQRYNLRHRRSNGTDDEPEPSSANGQAKRRNGVKRTSNGRRRV